MQSVAAFGDKTGGLCPFRECHNLAGRTYGTVGSIEENALKVFLFERNRHHTIELICGLRLPRKSPNRGAALTMGKPSFRVETLKIRVVH